MRKINISQELWREINDVLNRYQIPYTTHYERRDIQKTMGQQDITVIDKHIQINLVIPDYFEEEL